MKVLNLRCALDHRFEGWFTSDDDVNAQLGSAALGCPLCGNTAITRLPTAPHLRAPGSRSEAGASVAAPGEAPVTPQALQAALLRRWRELVSDSDDVGDRFANEARRIHYGEVEQRTIHGRASADEARELIDEGIEIVALPLPDALKGPLQ